MGNDNLEKKGAYILLVVFLLKIILGYFMQGINNTEVSAQLVSILGVQILAIFIPAFIFARLLKVDSEYRMKDVLKLRPIDRKHVLLCILIGCAVQAVSILINAPIAYLISRFFGNLPPQVIDATASTNGFFINIIIAALLPAICEEILFRGVIMTSQKNYGFGAILISAVYFTLMHHDISSFLGILLLGIVLGMATELTGSVYAAMIVHFFNNAFVFILQWLHGNLKDFIGVDTFYFLIGLIGIPILIYGLRKLPLHKFGKCRLKEGFVNIPFLLILFYYTVNQTVVLFSLL